MAMPTKLTPEVQEKIVSALNAGNYQDTAARYAGITRATFYNWLERGRIERERIESGEKPSKSEAIYVEFIEAIEQARANAEVRAVALIQKAATEGNWRAAQFFLERSHPQRWGALNRTEISGPQGGPIETMIDAETLDEKLTALLDKRKTK